MLNLDATHEQADWIKRNSAPDYPGYTEAQIGEHIAMCWSTEESFKQSPLYRFHSNFFDPILSITDPWNNRTNLAHFNPAEKRDAHGQWVREGYHAATDEERKKIGVPPAWEQVQIADDAEHHRPVIGRDKKGQLQSIYSAAHHERKAIAKFQRVQDIEKHMPKFEEDLRASLDSDPHAAPLLLVKLVGLRIGGEASLKGEEQAFGATTLEKRHVQVDGNKIYLDYIGKHQVHIRQSVEDPQLAAHMKALLETKGDTQQIFSVNDDQARERMKEMVPGSTPKDLRTRVGTAEALDFVSKQPPPANAKELQALKIGAWKAASARLGNNWQQARDSYVNPIVFSHIQVPKEKK